MHLPYNPIILFLAVYSREMTRSIYTDLVAKILNTIEMVKQTGISIR